MEEINKKYLTIASDCLRHRKNQFESGWNRRKQIIASPPESQTPHPPGAVDLLMVVVDMVEDDFDR
jgi:hypothetical protein